MTIKQFNGRYLPQPDRVLVKANTHSDEEISLFMTRRVVRQILAGGEQKSVELEAAQRPGPASAEVVRFQREALLQTTDFKQPYQGATRQALGDKPELVLDAAYGAGHGQGKPASELVLSLRSGRKLTLQLAQPTLQALCLLLEQLQGQAQWDLVPLRTPASAGGPSNAPSESSGRTVH